MLSSTLRVLSLREFSCCGVLTRDSWYLVDRLGRKPILMTGSVMVRRGDRQLHADDSDGYCAHCHGSIHQD